MMLRLVLVLISAAWVAFPVTAHAAHGDCGQPVTTGSSPTAADCLYILKTAVGALTCTPECICDVGAPDGVSASDALVCLKKAVGQPVTLDCGPSCTGATTTTMPQVLQAELVVLTKSSGSYATANLAGTWDLSSLTTGTGAVDWFRGSLTIQSNGNFSGSVTDHSGATDNVAGTLALSATGILTCTSDQCPIQFQGAMDSGKTFLAITYTGEDGTTELLLVTRRGVSYAQADLAGTVVIHDIASNHDAPWWVRGALVVEASGAASGNLTTSDGFVEAASVALTLYKGAITCSSGCFPNFRGALDSGKTIATATYTGDDGPHLMTMCKRAASYMQSDLAGTWRLNSLVSGEDTPLWKRGSVVIASNGTFSGSLSESTGANEDIAGVFTLASDGTVTVGDDDDFRCAMDADKTVVVCTNTN